MNFYMPTRIIIEKDCVINSSKILKEYGKKALIVTGSSSAKKSGALDEVISSLKNACCEYEIYDKIASIIISIGRDREQMKKINKMSIAKKLF